MRSIKRLIIIGLTIFIVGILAGCGSQGQAAGSSKQANNSGSQTSNQLTSSKSSTGKAAQEEAQAQQQVQTQNIDIKSAAGQAEVDQKIDQHLQSLDNALNTLDKSSGSL